ncbi:MAG: response regulator transcription factor [Pyrinomonadaceae bacterium MAG19_C2-C3]|nr:response regulator transcription factor [Pyrinomonadaceae bacterium MAG19_C2-C3]
MSFDLVDCETKMSKAVIKILIADDHAIVRQGLKQTVADQPDMTVAGEAQNAQETLRLVREQQWDVVVLDITMPDRSGLDLLTELKRMRPELPVLILSMHSEEQFAVRALKAKASGYITKQSAPKELVQAIRKVHCGGKYVSPSLAETLAFELGDDTGRAAHEKLSDREYQVLRMIAAGRTPKEIAAELNLSEKTVATYRMRVLEKMNMKRNAELVRYAVENRLVE